MNNNITYVGGKKASEILGVHQRTLYLWETLILLVRHLSL